MNIINNKNNIELYSLLEYIGALTNNCFSNDENNNYLTNTSIDIITSFLFNNWDRSNKNIDLIFQIIYYNYIYCKINHQCYLNQFSYTEIIEKTRPDELINILLSDYHFVLLIVKNYFLLIENPNNVNEIQNNYLILNSISTLKNDIEYDEVLNISEKIKKTLMDIYNLLNNCGMSDIEIELIVYDLLNENCQDFCMPFNFFESFQEFISYKPLIIEQLYLDSLIYQQCKSKTLGLSYTDQHLLDFIKYQLNSDKNKRLKLSNEEMTLQMIGIFYKFNKNKTKINKMQKDSINKCLILAQKKINPFSIFEYMN